MARKTKNDYIRHGLSIFDQNLQNTPHHIVDYYINGTEHDTIYNADYVVGESAYFDIKTEDNISLNLVMNNMGVAPKNIVIPKYTYDPNESNVYHRYKKDGNVVITSEYHPVSIPYSPSKVIIYMRYLRDVYSFDDIQSITTFNGNTIDKTTFWNTFKDYIVPVVANENEQGYEVGSKIPLIKNQRGLNNVINWLNPFYTDGIGCTYSNITMTIIFPTRHMYKGERYFTYGVDVLTDSRYDNYYNSFSAVDSLIQVLKSNNSCIRGNLKGGVGFPIPTSQSVESPKMRYFSVVERDNSLYYSPNNYSLNNSDLYFNGPYFYPASYFAPSSYMSPTYGDTLPLEERIRLTNKAEFYYEDIDVFDRSFDFTLNSAPNKTYSITAYNQAELENYLKVWKIPFEYANGWVTPLPDDFEDGKKIRHILLGADSVIGSEKVRHKIGGI